MPSKYKIGDLILLNEFGRLVMDDNRFRVGIITAGPFNMLHPSTQEPDLMYLSYHIMIGEALIKDVPETFLERIIEENHEENPKNLEIFLSGGIGKS